MNAITLKYPAGEFTQAEWAELNGLDKLAIYLTLKDAIEKGTVIKTGTRPTGKRPANLYKVADPNAPVAVTAPPIVQPIVETPPAQATPPVVNPEPNLPEAVILAKELDKAIQEHRPPEPTPQPVALSAPNPAFPCPLCQQPMTEIPDATGVKIWCNNPDPCIPGCSENPYGHGSNVKDAYKIACEKFRKPSE